MLAIQNSLQQRFSSALHWYGILTDIIQLRLHDYLDNVQLTLLDNNVMEGDSG